MPACWWLGLAGWCSVALVLLPLAARRASQSGWIVGIGLFGMAGMSGGDRAGSSASLWSLLIGVGMGCSRWHLR